MDSLKLQVIQMVDNKSKTSLIRHMQKLLSSFVIYFSVYVIQEVFLLYKAVLHEKPCNHIKMSSDYFRACNHIKMSSDYFRACFFVDLFLI